MAGFSGVSVDLFVSTLRTISRHLTERGLPDDVHADDLNALQSALARIEGRAHERAKEKAEKPTKERSS